MQLKDESRKGFTESRLIRKRTLRFGKSLAPQCRPKTPLNLAYTFDDREPLISVSNYQSLVEKEEA